MLPFFSVFPRQKLCYWMTLFFNHRLTPNATKNTIKKHTKMSFSKGIFSRVFLNGSFFWRVDVWSQQNGHVLSAPRQRPCLAGAPPVVVSAAASQAWTIQDVVRNNSNFPTDKISSKPYVIWLYDHHRIQGGDMSIFGESLGWRSSKFMNFLQFVKPESKKMVLWKDSPLESLQEEKKWKPNF